MKTLMPGIVGNEALKERLAPMLSSGSLSHAYIIEGPAGIGKKTFARHFAAAAACEHGDGDTVPCGKCRSCRMILSGICPDVTFVGPEGKASIGVDRIREICADVHIYPNDLDYRIYVIDGADTMTPQAQNAFLLTLEEPPKYVLFLLLCENSGRLLETVRSRAPRFRMQPLSREDVGKVVAAEMPEAEKIRRNDPERFGAAVMSSGGAAGRAMQLLGGKDGNADLARRRTAVGFLELASARGKGAEASLLLMKNAGTREEISALLDTVIAASRDLILINRDENAPLLFFPDREKAAALSESFPIRRLLSISYAASDAKEAVSRGMNIRLTVTDMLAKSGII